MSKLTSEQERMNLVTCIMYVKGKIFSVAQIKALTEDERAYLCENYSVSNNLAYGINEALRQFREKNANQTDVFALR